MIRICREQGFKWFEGVANMMRGWALGSQQDVEAGLAQFDRGWSVYRSVKGKISASHFLARKVELCARGGHIE